MEGDRHDNVKLSSYSAIRCYSLHWNPRFYHLHRCLFRFRWVFSLPAGIAPCYICTTKTRTTPYHPKSDGMVERFNRTLETMLSACIGACFVFAGCFLFQQVSHPATYLRTSCCKSGMCQMLGTTKTRTTPYHQKSDGMVERFNRTTHKLCHWLQNVPMRPFCHGMSFVAKYYPLNIF
jgi:hypothetical protein